MLLPLGGEDFGFKGAALAGVATILSAVLQGMTLDHAMIPMVGAEDMSVPRGMGQFFLAIEPGSSAGARSSRRGCAPISRRCAASPAREGAEVMAPGDREWRVAAEREREGIPLDPETAAFLGF